MNKKLFTALAVLFPALLICGFIFRSSLIAFGELLPPCPFYILSGYYCPGCGNTRSVTHLLGGDILLSLRCNITPLFLLILFTLLYAEMIFSLAGKRVCLLPRNKATWVCVIVLFLAYYILRNFIPILAPV